MELKIWQIAAFIASFLLAAYGIATKQFFLMKYDWRAFIPLVALSALVLSAYYLYTGGQKEIQSGSYTFAVFLGIIFVLATAASFLAINDGPVSVVVPILSMNLVFVVIFGIVLFKEQLSVYKIAGVLLGLISILLLSLEGK